MWFRPDAQDELWQPVTGPVYDKHKAEIARLEDRINALEDEVNLLKNHISCSPGGAEFLAAKDSFAAAVARYKAAEQ